MWAGGLVLAEMESAGMLGAAGDHTCGSGLWYRVEAGSPGGVPWEGEGTQKLMALRQDKWDLVMCGSWRMGEKKGLGAAGCKLPFAQIGRSQLGEMISVWVMIRSL